MNEEKRKIGFRTSITEIQEKLDEIRRFLNAQKAEWAEIIKLANSEETRVRQDLQAHLNLQKCDTNFMVMLTRIIEHWYITGIIGRLGVDVTNMHERLTDIEKDLKELKLHIK